MAKPLQDLGDTHNNDTHTYYLEALIHRLEDVGETRADIAWIMRDGIWMPQESMQRNKFPDLICVYYDNHAAAIELKGSYGQRQKAKEQLTFGAHFALTYLHVTRVVRKFVWYDGDRYGWELIESDRMPNPEKLNGSAWVH